MNLLCGGVVYAVPAEMGTLVIPLMGCVASTQTETHILPPLIIQEVPYIRTFRFWTLKDVNVCSTNIRHEWNCSLPSLSYCWWSFSSAISHLLSLLQWVTLLACSLDASPCVPAIVPYYCTFKVLHFKDVFFIFVCFFMYYLCEKYYKPITVQHYRADCVCWVPRLTLWTYE